MLEGRGVKLSKELVQKGGAVGSTRGLKHGLESPCEHTHSCALERMRSEISSRTFGGSGWGWMELVLVWHVCHGTNYPATSWREFIYYALISVHLIMSFLKSRLFSACSDKNLSPVRFMVSSYTIASVATTERWSKYHLCLFRLSRKVEKCRSLHPSGWMTFSASLA